MARTVTYEIIPGAVAPAGAPTMASINATNHRRVSPYVAPYKTLLDRLPTTPLPGLQETNFQTFTRLQKAGLLASDAGPGKFDTFNLEMGIADGILYNWAKAAHDFTNVGCTQSRSLGLIANGVDQSIDTNYLPASQAVLYTRDAASAWMWISGPNPQVETSDSIMGRQSGTDLIRLAPGNSPNNPPAGRINAATSVAGTAGTGSSNVLGLFLANRTNDHHVDVYRNGALAATSDANASSAVPDAEVAWFKNSTTFYQGSVLAGGMGGPLSTQNIADLSAILTDHFAMLALALAA